MINFQFTPGSQNFPMTSSCYRILLDWNPTNLPIDPPLDNDDTFLGIWTFYKLRYCTFRNGIWSDSGTRVHFFITTALTIFC